MRTQHDGHRDAAVAALAARDHGAASEAYARAAWHVLAEPRPGQSPFDADEKGRVGAAIRYLVTAAIAARVAGRPERATHRAVEGVAVARDLRSALDRPVQRACLDEFVADCRVAGGLDGAEAAYEAAADAYRDAAAGDGDGNGNGNGNGIGDPRDPATTPLFEAAAGPIKQVARGPADGEIAVSWSDLHGPVPADPEAFLAARPAYKRRRFPGLVERAVADGRLAAPRGTTEYDTGRYRCPDCGADDVNWVADSVLCLRCSAATAER